MDVCIHACGCRRVVYGRIALILRLLWVPSSQYYSLNLCSSSVIRRAVFFHSPHPPNLHFPPTDVCDFFIDWGQNPFDSGKGSAVSCEFYFIQYNHLPSSSESPPTEAVQRRIAFFLFVRRCRRCCRKPSGGHLAKDWQPQLATAAHQQEWTDAMTSRSEMHALRYGRRGKRLRLAAQDGECS